MSFDRDKGMTIRFHPSGARVGMYKDTPGVYYDGKGERVNKDMAREAGFDVERLARERRKQKKIQKAKERIEAEEEQALRQAEEEAEREADDEDYEVYHAGGGKYAVRDAEGNRLCDPTTKEEAEAAKQGLIDQQE